MKPNFWSVDERPLPTTPRSKWRRFVDLHLPSVVIVLMVATLVLVVLWPRILVTVPSGQVGVLWKRFAGGTVLDPRQLKDEGLHLILPWDQLFLYDLRLQSLTDTYNAISSDGVSMKATLNIRFRLQHNAIPILHQVIGPDYKILLAPLIASRMRGVIAEYTAEQVYSTGRQEIESKIRESAIEVMSQKTLKTTSYELQAAEGLVLYDTLLYGIELPAAIAQAINRKTEQYYVAEEYQFRIERERRESERKAIEARGIREFQQIVSQGISDSYLRWRGVEATLQLAQSNNSKVVIIGGGKDGLPIILGNVDSPAPMKKALGTPPVEDGTRAGDRVTAATPAVPLERTPAAALSIPAEKMPAVDSATPRETAQAAPAAAPPAEPRSLWPLSLSDLESLLSRLLHSTDIISTRQPTGEVTSEQSR